MPISLLPAILLSVQIQLLPNQEYRVISIYNEQLPTAAFQEMAPDGQLGEVQIIK